MHLKYLSIVTVATARLPTSHAIYDPDADTDGVVIGNEDGDVMVTTLSLVPEDGEEPPAGAAVSDTNTAESISNDIMKPIPGPSQHSLLVGPTWAATKYYDASEGKLVDVADGTTITLEFEDNDRFDGHGGCNLYSGSFGASVEARSSVSDKNFDDSSFTITSPLMSTKMACEKAIMDQEFAYMANLEGTINFNITNRGTSLQLKDSEADNVIAEYTHFTPLIFNQKWSAVKYYNSEQGGLIDVIPGSSITFMMEVDESYGGDAGCNSYFGSYDDLTSTSFAIAGPSGNTEMFCAKPANLMDQERVYLENFETGRKMNWEVLDDGSLELKDPISDDIIALYTVGPKEATSQLSSSGGVAIGTKSEEDAQQLSSSGGMAIGTTIMAAFAIVPVIVIL